MSQGNLVMPTVGVVSGLTMAQDMNSALAALYTQNSGSSAPTNAAGGVPALGQLWLDTTSATLPILKQYDGANWNVIGAIDVTNSIWTPPIAGGVATTLASASTTDLGSKRQAYLTVSGVVTITSLGSSAAVGTIHVVTFSGILTLTHNAASLILPTAANITTAAGDVAAFVMTTAGNWKCLWYSLASGAPLSTTAVGAQQLLASAQGMDMPLNLRINATVGASALTVAIKTAANADASASSPILIPFRDPTLANGDPIIASLQSALSFTVASTNTMGTTSGIPFRLWVCLYYNGGTPAVGLFLASASTQIYMTPENTLVTTAASTNGGSSGFTHYANVSTITNTPFRIIGHLDFASGEVTAGTWATAPTTINLFGPGSKKPGDPIQVLTASSTSTTTGAGTTPTAISMTLPLTPFSSMNRVLVRVFGNCENAATQFARCIIVRNGTGIGAEVDMGSAAAIVFPIAIEAFDAPNTTSSVTYGLDIISSGANNPIWNPNAMNCSMIATELMG